MRRRIVATSGEEEDIHEDQAVPEDECDTFNNEQRKILLSDTRTDFTSTYKSDASDDHEVCCICLLDLQRPVASLGSCNHPMCANCAVQNVWKLRLAGLARCPLCRQRIRRLQSTPQPEHNTQPFDRYVELDFAGVRWCLALQPKESVQHLIDHVFDISPQKAKVMGKGGVLLKDWNELVVTYPSLPTKQQTSHHRVYKMMATPRHDPDAERANWETSFANQVLQWIPNPETVWATFREMVMMVWLFFVSLSPWNNPGVQEQRERRERERERRRNQDA
mmetsp:Transcript_15172/g.29482  ORF Transcript_15172/g.29482 Transcript_15172/m.29482 type:complete len:278 (+) Transcript_15172:131-964(+)